MNKYGSRASGLQVFIAVFLGVVLVGFIAWQIIINYEGKNYEPGIQAPDDPIQGRVTNEVSFQRDEFTIIPMATFKIKGRVLSKKRYYLGQESELSPYDLAMGWGRMSDVSILDKIKIQQFGRWYTWRTKDFPIPRREIESCSANMHIIPANREIKKALRKAGKWDLVQFKGYLVKVIGDNFRWKSSLSRYDKGDHACEVVWVEDFQIIK